ncbi:triose-phosphate isomerase family protein [Candidatus Dependentiae bacterium]
MFLYVANWKMEMSFDKAVEFCKDNFDGFIGLSQLESKKVILCPEFTQLKAVLDVFGGNGNDIMALGAQDCSEHKPGAYTGQVLAESLGQIGCNYCIVGHSERRIYGSETSDQVACKLVRLFECGITPIVCIGESKEDYENGLAKDVLQEQLEPIWEVVKAVITRKGGGKSGKRLSFCIAYEPVWSIGTGITPENSYIQEIFNFIVSLAKNNTINAQINLLYGGSVDERKVKSLKLIDNLGGFLLGGASLDFKKFEKIVQL